MPANEVQLPTSASVDFLLEEYRMLHGRYHSLRNEGINRMNFFLTFTSATLGGVLLLGASSTLTPTFFKLVLLGVPILLASVGFDVYQYMVVRDVVSDRVVRGMGRIRRYFIEHDAALKDFVVFSYDNEPTFYLAKKRSEGVRRTAQTVQVFTVGLAVGIISDLFSLPLGAAIGLGLVAAGVDFYLLNRFANQRFTAALIKAQNEIRFPAISKS